jgi:hypothetical protein
VQAEWRWMLGLCLVAALFGPVLRRAEAADDLARLLFNLTEPSDIEPSDGGVGDEPEAGIAKLHVHGALQPLAADRCLFYAAFASLTSLPNVASAPSLVSGALLPPESARERLARLPNLRF